MIELFDNTSLSTFKLCPMKYKWRMVDHLIPIVEDNFKAYYGVAFHKAMEVWYTTKSQDQTIKAFVDSWSPYEGHDKTNLRTIMNGVKLLNEYFKIYETEPFTIHRVEIGFTSELNSKYLYHGKCDGLIEYVDGNFYVLEHKTSASKGYLSLKPNHQIDGYIFGVGQVFNGKVNGCIFNQIYLSKKQNEFIRELTLRDEIDINSFIIDTTMWCDKINEYNTNNRWPKNTNSCNAFWKSCEYKNLCSSPSISIPSIIENCYKVEKWHPFDEVVNE